MSTETAPQASLSVRTTAREQIEQAIQVARTRKQPLRVRIPFGLYNYGAARGYTFVRDAAWNLTLPSEITEAAHIESYIQAIGRCIVAITEEGVDAVLDKLGDGPTQTPDVGLEDEPAEPA